MMSLYITTDKHLNGLYTGKEIQSFKCSICSQEFEFSRRVLCDEKNCGICEYVCDLCHAHCMREEI